MKKNITLQVRVPKEVGISILGRLYGGGYISKEQYEEKVSQIDNFVLEKEEKKRMKMDKMLSKTRKFWKKRTK